MSLLNLRKGKKVSLKNINSKSKDALPLISQAKVNIEIHA